MSICQYFRTTRPLLHAGQEMYAQVVGGAQTAGILYWRGNMHPISKLLCVTVALVLYESSWTVVNSPPNRFLQLLRSRVDPYCNRSCHSDVDCNQGGGCMQCDYYRNKSGTFKFCQTLSETCGGPPSPPNSSLPQYLAIGDSITYGQFPFIKADLEGTCEAHLVTRNAGPTEEGVKCKEVWVGSDLDRWDVISFNFGAWDTARQTSGAGGTPLPEYAQNLKKITEFLVTTKAGKTGKLIYVLTTPSANTKECCPANHSCSRIHGFGTLSCPSIIRQYNDVAKQVMASFSPMITIDNLWSWANKHCCGSEDCWYKSCDFQPGNDTCQVRFPGSNGWQYLAQNVSATVREVLNS